MIEVEVLKTKLAEMQALPFVALQGPKGDTGATGPKGDKGDPGNDYVLTDADKQEIADKVDLSGTVSDVQVDGVSIVTDRVAKVPIATGAKKGVVSASGAYGIGVGGNGQLTIIEPTLEQISSRYSAQRRLIPLNRLDYAVKAAMCDGKGAAWSDAEKVASQKRIGIDETNRKLDFLWKLNQGISYQFETDETVAYSKTIPSGAKVAAIHNIGGRSFVWNQMIPETIIDKTYQGVTFATEDGRTFRISGTATSNNCYTLVCRVNLIQNHTYVLGRVGNYTAQNNNDFIAICAQTTTYYWAESTDGAFSTFTCAESGLYNVFLYFMKGSGLTVDAEITPQLFDVTAMFGAGSEPTTVDEFRAMFPEDYYPYCDNTIVDATSRSIAVGDRTVDLSWLAAKYFPDGMRSAGDVYDELDLENGVAIQRIGSAVLDGTKKWVLTGTSTDNVQGYAMQNKLIGAINNKATILCEKFTYSQDETVVNSCRLTESTYGVRFSVSVDIVPNKTTGEWVEFLSANPQTILFPLAEPIVTPITEDLSAFVGISSESGGSVTFVSELDEQGMNIPVPNKEEYLISLSEVNG